MGVLLLEGTADLKYYGNIPYLCPAVQAFKVRNVEKRLHNFGEIFVKHGAWKYFALSMLHRHFDMDLYKELLVETLRRDGSGSVALPWQNLDGKNVVPPSLDTDTATTDVWNKYDLLEEKYIVPQSWAFDTESGELKAFEFQTANEKLSSPSETFVSDLFSALKKEGVAHLVGLRRIDSAVELSSWETTPEGVRANVTIVGKEIPPNLTQMNMIKVAWRFDSDGKLKECQEWCGNCCNHCNHCHHY